MLCLTFTISDKLALPMEILLHVFQYCSAEDLARLSLASKDFQVLASDESLWSSLFAKKFAHINNEKLKKKLDEMCCSKHRYGIMENEVKRQERIAKSVTTVQPSGTKPVSELKKGEIVVLNGKCCRIVDISHAK